MADENTNSSEEIVYYYYYYDTSLDDPVIRVIDNVMNHLHIVQYLGLVIEMVFFFVMIRNWYMNNTFLKSAFFYFTTLKIVGDFIFMLYEIVTTRWYTELMPSDYYTYFFLGYFYTEIDALSQFAISVNRYTALMMPFKHKSVSFKDIFIQKYLSVL